MDEVEAVEAKLFASKSKTSGKAAPRLGNDAGAIFEMLDVDEDGLCSETEAKRGLLSLSLKREHLGHILRNMLLAAQRRDEDNNKFALEENGGIDKAIFINEYNGYVEQVMTESRGARMLVCFICGELHGRRKALKLHHEACRGQWADQQSEARPHLRCDLIEPTLAIPGNHATLQEVIAYNDQCIDIFNQNSCAGLRAPLFLFCHLCGDMVGIEDIEYHIGKCEHARHSEHHELDRYYTRVQIQIEKLQRRCAVLEPHLSPNHALYNPKARARFYHVDGPPPYRVFTEVASQEPFPDFTELPPEEESIHHRGDTEAVDAYNKLSSKHYQRPKPCRKCGAVSKTHVQAALHKFQKCKADGTESGIESSNPEEEEEGGAEVPDLSQVLDEEYPGEVDRPGLKTKKKKAKRGEFEGDAMDGGEGGRGPLMLFCWRCGTVKSLPSFGKHRKICLRLPFDPI